MTGYRFPNESDDYRDRRDELLEKEILERLGLASPKLQARPAKLDGPVQKCERFVGCARNCQGGCDVAGQIIVPLRAGVESSRRSNKRNPI
jgi:hypothetical protein